MFSNSSRKTLVASLSFVLVFIFFIPHIFLRFLNRPQNRFAPALAKVRYRKCLLMGELCITNQ